MSSSFEQALDEPRIRALLVEGTRGFEGRVVVLERTESTNDDAKALAREDAPHGTVVLAEEQTRGRGRGGTTWLSPPRQNLMLSIILRARRFEHSPAPFALCAGLAVARAVDTALASRRAALKWPNDVYVADKKIAGILLEASHREGRGPMVVAGIGLNIFTTAFPESIAKTATSLAIEGANALDRSTVAADVVGGVLAAWATFTEEGLAASLDEIRERDWLAGRSVTVEGVSGIARGIAGDGQLRVLDASGTEQLVTSGHVDVTAHRVAP